MFGYVSVDFVAFKDPNNLDAHPLFWAIDIDFHLTMPVQYLHFITFYWMERWTLISLIRK